MNVEELMRLLRQPNSTQPRFRIGLEQGQCEQLLLAAYRVGVESRHMRFMMTEDLEQNLARVAAALVASEPKLGIMLAGCPGNGKTTMLYAIRAVINLLKDRGHFRNYDDRVFHVGLWIADARDIVKGAQEIDLQNPKIPNFGVLKNYDMIAIEDMGKEPKEVMNYGNVISPIVELLEHRYERQKYTSITTNLTLEQIREKYGARVYDRLAETMCLIVYEREEKDSYRKMSQII